MTQINGLKPNNSLRRWEKWRCRRHVLQNGRLNCVNFNKIWVYCFLIIYNWWWLFEKNLTLIFYYMLSLWNVTNVQNVWNVEVGYEPNWRPCAQPQRQWMIIIWFMTWCDAWLIRCTFLTFCYLNTSTLRQLYQKLRKLKICDEFKQLVYLIF